MDQPLSAGNKRICPEAPGGKLMVSGLIHLVEPEISCKVQRGMAILSRDGQEIGKVAALVVQDGAEFAGEILLSRLPEVQGYWLVQVEQIQGVTMGGVQLDLTDLEAARLKVWHVD